MTTVVHQSTTVVKAEPEPTPSTLIELRSKYRAGLIVLGELFAALDRFLDGPPHAEATPHAKEKAWTPKS
jgi:hypothetical protein